MTSSLVVVLIRITVIVKEPPERRLWDVRAIVARWNGGVMKNRQVKVTKVTGSSPFGK